MHPCLRKISYQWDRSHELSRRDSATPRTFRRTPFSPTSGPAAGSFTGFHPKSNFLAVETLKPNIKVLLRWAKVNQLDQIAALRPEVGPLKDSLKTLRIALSQAGNRLVLIGRPEDLRIRHFATGGFFQFWERIRKTLFAASVLDHSSKTQQLSLEFPR